MTYYVIIYSCIHKCNIRKWKGIFLRNKKYITNIVIGEDGYDAQNNSLAFHIKDCHTGSKVYVWFQVLDPRIKLCIGGVCVSLKVNKMIIVCGNYSCNELSRKWRWFKRNHEYVLVPDRKYILCITMVSNCVSSREQLSKVMAPW